MKVLNMIKYHLTLSFIVLFESSNTWFHDILSTLPPLSNLCLKMKRIFTFKIVLFFYCARKCLTQKELGVPYFSHITECYFFCSAFFHVPLLHGSFLVIRKL